MKSCSIFITSIKQKNDYNDFFKKKTEQRKQTIKMGR